MSRAESFGIGVAMVAVALTVLMGSYKAAWALLILGCVFIGHPYYLDWRYGKYRPDGRELALLSVDDYKKRIREDPRLARWINHLFKNDVVKPFNPDDF